MTDFDTQCEILADLWLNYKEHEALRDFVEYNDLGLPLAYLVHADLARVTDEGTPYIEETFNLLCASLALDDDGEYSTLNEMLQESEDEEE